jgi:hypothetical protein
MTKVFLSYATADAASVQKIADALTLAGHIVKLGRSSIDTVDGGGRLAATVFALKHCDVVALLLSPNSVKSPAIADELTLAEQTYKSVVPVFLDSVKLPPNIARPLRYLPKIDCSESFSVGLTKLMAAVARR